MKKLIMVFLGVLIVAGCTNDPYKIDPVLTANAPWKVGDIVHGNELANLRFLGRTQDGYDLLQEYRIVDGRDGDKGTEPYLLMNKEAIDGKEPALFHGRRVVYQSNGAVKSDCTYSHGTLVSSPCILWDKDHNRRAEQTASYDNGVLSRTYTEYDGEVRRGVVQEHYTYATQVSERVITEYHPSGEIRSNLQDRNKRPYGIYQVWDKEGNLIHEEDLGTPQN